MTTAKDDCGSPLTFRISWATHPLVVEHGQRLREIYDAIKMQSAQNIDGLMVNGPHGELLQTTRFKSKGRYWR